MLNVLLSASVPYPGRNELYLKTANVIAIKSSIKALAQIFVPRSNIVFGSHPAITPLLYNMLRQMPEEFHTRIKPYVSRVFEGNFPPDLGKFIDIKYTENVGGDLDQSKDFLRQCMIRETDFDAAIFIGGMDGVEEEYDLFKSVHSDAPTYLIASTGGAALELYNKYEIQRKDLLTQRTYPKLFRQIMLEITNELNV